MTEPNKARGYSRLLLLVVALLLPALSLIPLGSLWLWQRGYILYWALATAVVVAAVYYLQRRLILPLPPSPEKDTADAEDRGDGAWTPRQAEAWDDVIRLASQVRAERITSRDEALNLALETIEVVAKRLHPERRDPLLQFTVPEALAVIERASANLRGFLVGSFPLGDRITVAQLMWLYRWRGALTLAEKGYDLWRIVRLLNPVAAVTQELRERFTKQLYEAGRDHLAGRLARAFVKEVGRAAVDLYGGNLRVMPEQLGRHVTAASRADMAAAEAREAEPIRILVAGQTGAGKSSLVNALANAVEAAVDALPTTARFTGYRLTHDGLSAALIVDSPGLEGATELVPLMEAADDCDMIVWVCSAARAAREIDANALAAIRTHFAAEPNRHRPPMLLVLTHIDNLRPFDEWDPPYDLTQPTRGKCKSISGRHGGGGSRAGLCRRRDRAGAGRHRGCALQRRRGVGKDHGAHARGAAGPAAAHAGGHQERFGLGGRVVAGGQCRPRCEGNLSLQEPHAMTQLEKAATDKDTVANAKARKPEREPQERREPGATAEGNGDTVLAFDPWTRASQVATIGVFIIALFWCAYVAEPVIVPVLLAWAIATIVLPLVRWLGARGVPRIVAVLAVTVLLIAVFVCLLVLLSTPVAYWLGRATEVGGLIKQKLQTMTQPLALLEELQKSLNAIGAGSGQPALRVEQQSATVVTTIFSILTPAVSQFILFIGALVFYLAYQKKLRSTAVHFVNERETRLTILRTLSDIDDNMTTYFGTFTIVNICLGLTTVCLTWLVGLPNPLLWGVLAAVLNYIPYIGPAIVVGTLGVVGLLTYSTLSEALIAPLAYLVIATVEGHFITPALMGRRLELNPFAVFLAIAFCTWLWGPVGAFLAVPLLMALAVAFGHAFSEEAPDLPE